MSHQRSIGICSAPLHSWLPGKPTRNSRLCLHFVPTKIETLAGRSPVSWHRSSQCATLEAKYLGPPQLKKKAPDTKSIASCPFCFLPLSLPPWSMQPKPLQPTQFNKNFINLTFLKLHRHVSRTAQPAIRSLTLARPSGTPGRSSLV